MYVILEYFISSHKITMFVTIRTTWMLRYADDMELAAADRRSVGGRNQVLCRCS
jgi:hypothetical protein